MKKIEFKSKDGLLITADYYEVSGHKGIILLCHRSHCNRAEYRETAPKFNLLGYSCLAIDQRSGMKVFGENNETKNRAKELKLPTGFLDAKPDVIAGIEYAYKLNNNKPIILLGSSYSAALSLLVAKDNNLLASIILFSPGEYLKGIALAEEIKGTTTPIFAASAKKEVEETKTILRHLNPDFVTQYRPIEDGFHGSKILWDSVPGYQRLWSELEKFLS